MFCAFNLFVYVLIESSFFKQEVATFLKVRYIYHIYFETVHKSTHFVSFNTAGYNPLRNVCQKPLTLEKVSAKIYWPYIHANAFYLAYIILKKKFSYRRGGMLGSIFLPTEIIDLEMNLCGRVLMCGWG